MKLFKDNVEGLADVVTYICDLNLRTGVALKNLMIAVVTCLFKSGNKNWFQKLWGYFDISCLQQILEN